MSRWRERAPVVALLLSVAAGGFGYGVIAEHFGLFPVAQLEMLWHGIGSDRGGSEAVSTARGERIFRAQCQSCHGTEGAGGRGPAFRGGRLADLGSRSQILQVVRNGRPGTDMPGFGQSLSPEDRASVIAYVESLDAIPSTPIVPADSARGAQLFFGTGGCVACHRVGSRGGRLGPDLSRVGLRRGTEYLRRSILDPAADISPEFRLVSLVDARGDSIRGFVLNESAFSIQILDLKERLRSLRKADLRAAHLLDGSLMPDYSDRLSERQVGNLVTYLRSLVHR